MPSVAAMASWRSLSGADDDHTAPVVSAARLRTAFGRFGGGPLVLAALIVWNVSNYAFFLLAGRALGPDEFGLVAALLAVPVIMSVPCNALQYGVARSVATDPDPNEVYVRSWRTATTVGALIILIAAVGIALTEQISPSISAMALLLTAVSVALLPPLFLSLGRLQGGERFLPYALTFSAWGVPRPLAFLALAAVGLGVTGAIGASALAVAAAVFMGAWLAPPRATRKASPDDAPWERFRSSLVPVTIGLSAVAVLVNLDVIAAKLALDAKDAGHYSAAAVLGKAIIVVPQTLALVLLPRVATRTAEGIETSRQLALATLASLTAGVLGVATCLWLAEPIMRIAFGEKFLPAADFLAPLVVGGTLLGLTLVLVTHHAARGQYRFLYGIGLLTLGYPVALAMFGATGIHIAVIGIAFGLASLLLHELAYHNSTESILAGIRALASRRADGARGRGR